MRAKKQGGKAEQGRLKKARLLLAFALHNALSLLQSVPPTGKYCDFVAPVL